MTARSSDEAAAEEREPGASSRLGAIGRTLLVPFLAVVTALIIGAFVLVFTNPDTLGYWNAFGADPLAAFRESGQLVSDSYVALLQGSFGSLDALSETLFAATPLLLAGLAVGFAFRAGLFNIGGSGQLLIGTLVSAYIGFSFDLPPVIHVLAALVGGILAGSVWGGVVGLLKARTGAHEVITTIMLNYIALRLVDYALSTETFLRPGRQDPITPDVRSDAELPGLLGDDYRVHLGLVVALLAAVGVWWLLFRSTLGFRLRAVGANPAAAAYAGMSVAATWVVAMGIAGGLAGAAGAVQLLGAQRSMTGGLSTIGFDAIAIALLGRSHPAGIAAAALLFGALTAGAAEMQAEAGVSIEIVSVIQALVIMFIAAPALIRGLWRVRAGKSIDRQTVTVSWGS